MPIKNHRRYNSVFSAVSPELRKVVCGLDAGYFPWVYTALTLARSDNMIIMIFVIPATNQQRGDGCLNRAVD